MDPPHDRLDGPDGVDDPIDDWLDLGARIVELERVFNNARGFDRCDLGGDEGGSSGGDGNGAGGSRSENASADD